MEKTITHLPTSDYLMDTEGAMLEMEIPYTLTNPSYLNAKRIIDLFISGIVYLTVFIWLYPIIAILIKSTSKGPVFFKQLRHGKDNVPFYCYKFRTMVVNDDADRRQATKNDPRVTRIGAFLRKTSLDELPQILNVLKGEMSVVGPRPHPIILNESFSRDIKNLMSRHVVKPGITGLAQSKGFRGETKEFYQMNSRFKLDIFYVKNWSLLLDLKIILWTSLALISKNNNAY